MSRIKDFQDEQEYIQKAKAVEKKYGIPDNMMVGLLRTESNFNPRAVSKAGAKGVAQFMDSTAKQYGIDPFNVDQSIEAAGKYLASSYKTFGNWDDTLRSYNMGVQGVKDWKAGKRTLPKETQDYVGKIYKNGNLSTYSTNVAPYINSQNINLYKPNLISNIVPQGEYSVPDVYVEPTEEKTTETSNQEAQVDPNTDFFKKLQDFYTSSEPQQEGAPKEEQQPIQGTDVFGIFNQVSQFVDNPLMQEGGKKKPVYVESTNDPRYKAYQDSLNLYNKYDKKNKQFEAITNKNNVKTAKTYADNFLEVENNKIAPIGTNTMMARYGTENIINNQDKQFNKKDSQLLKDMQYRIAGEYSILGRIPIYKKPQQQVILKEQQRDFIQPIQNNLQSAGLVHSNLDIETLLPNIQQPVKLPKGYTYNQTEGGNQQSGTINSDDELRNFMERKNMTEGMPNWLGIKNEYNLFPQYQQGGTLTPEQEKASIASQIPIKNILYGVETTVPKQGIPPSKGLIRVDYKNGQSDYLKSSGLDTLRAMNNYRIYMEELAKKQSLQDVNDSQMAVLQEGGTKYPPISTFKKGQENSKVQLSSREENNLALLIKETELANQDQQELKKTGQIKNPRSLHYKKLVPKQAEVKQDNISTEQRNAQLSPLQRPLIYLASPEKLLGDLGVPNMETSELDRQAIAKNTFNSNQTREERFLNNAKLGLGYVPEATINTALAAAFMPEGSGALGLVNETLNPLAGSTSLIGDFKQGIKELFDTFNPNLLNARSGEDWIKNWYNHPETKIKASAYDIIDENGNLDREYLDSGSKVEIAKVSLKDYKDKDYLDLLKDKGIVEYLDKSLRSSGVSWGVPENIYVKSKQLFGFNQVGRESTKVHELTHLAENNGRVLNNNEISALLEPFSLDKKLKPTRDEAYYKDPTEIHARMNEARYRLGLTPDQVFTTDHFDKIQKERDWFGMGKYIKDKDKFVKLMNNFYVSSPIAGASYLAIQGQEEPKKFQQGGIIKDQQGQRKFPNQVTEIQGNRMSTDGYGDIALFVVPDKGEPRIVYPNTGEHVFEGATKFTEYPILAEQKNFFTKYKNK